MTHSDYQLSTSQSSPILQVNRELMDAPEEAFWFNYHRLQEALSSADRVNLNVINPQTGKVNSYQQIRFDIKNFYQRH